MPRLRLASSVLALLLAVAPAAAQTAAAAPVAADTGADANATAPILLDRVALMGASATFGFGTKVLSPDEVDVWGAEASLGDVMSVALGDTGTVVSTKADAFFFSKAMTIGPKLAAATKASKPTLVIGVDFLFWFGYGDRDKDGQVIETEDARFALLEEGFKLLEQFDCPVIVGDFPNMGASVGRMLNAKQMPAQATLAKLNSRLREWAKAHPNVHVVPLAELVNNAVERESIRAGGYTWGAHETYDLLQDDRLHPTTRGLVALAQLVSDALAAQGVDTSSFELHPDKVVAALKAKAEAQKAATPAGAGG